MAYMTNSGCKCFSLDSCPISEEFDNLFSSHYISLAELMKREGFSGSLPECKKTILVIDVDSWEIEQARKERRSLRSTVDFVSLLTKKNFLLVDAKFNVETNKINSSFLRGVKAKIDYTKPLFYKYLPVHERMILLFQTKKVEQCRNRIRQLQSNKSDIEVMDIFKFYNEFVL